MSKSIFEKECERLQPILLERKSKMNERQTVELVKEAIKIYSFAYASGYALAKIMIFSGNEKPYEYSKLTFGEAVSKLKDVKPDECPLVFDGYVYATAKIYGRTPEEIEDILVGKKYWMGYGSE